MPLEQPDPPGFLDASDNFIAFKRDLTAGGLRWLASVLAIASMILLGCIWVDLAPPEIHYPVHIQGPAVFWVIGGASLLWAWLAIANWSNYLGDRRRPSPPWRSDDLLEG